MHRFVEGFVLQGGDVTRGDGSGGESICELSRIVFSFNFLILVGSYCIDTNLIKGLNDTHHFS
jgi:hypothetical protein